MATIESLKSMRIGCDHVVWCELLQDDGASAPIYATDINSGSPSETILELPGVITLNINPNSSIETLFYDDGPGDVASSVGNIEITFQKSALSPSERAVLLGQSKNLQSILFHGKLDIAPWGALGFRTLKSDGSYRYIWLYKGKFIEPDDTNETKADTINFQTDEITARFVKLNWPYPVVNFASGTGVSTIVKPWKAEMDSSVYGGNALADIWFNSVVLPDVNILPPFSSGGPYGYILWKDVSGPNLYWVEMTSNITVQLDVTGVIDGTGAGIASYYIFENGAWVDNTGSSTTAAINVATQTVMYNSMTVLNSLAEIVAIINTIPGVTVQ